MTHKGKPLSPEHKAAISATLKGRRKGVPIPPEQRAKISATLKISPNALKGPKHYRWAGDDEIGKGAAHQWLGRFPKTGTCEECGATPPSRTTKNGYTRGGTDYAFLKHPDPYTRNRDDYRELCKSCHKRFDRGLA